MTTETRTSQCSFLDVLLVPCKAWQLLQLSFLRCGGHVLLPLPFPTLVCGSVFPLLERAKPCAVIAPDPTASQTARLQACTKRISCAGCQGYLPNVGSTGFLPWLGHNLGQRHPQFWILFFDVSAVWSLPCPPCPPPPSTVWDKKGHSCSLTCFFL